MDVLTVCAIILVALYLIAVSLPFLCDHFATRKKGDQVKNRIISNILCCVCILDLCLAIGLTFVVGIYFAVVWLIESGL